MKTIKGPAIFLAQFVGDKAPFDTLDNMCRWAASLGYKGIQIPTWASNLIDIDKAATVEDLLRRAQGHRRKARPRHHRALEPHHRPARRRAPGLRHAVRWLCAQGSPRQSEGAAEVGGEDPHATAPRPRRTSASRRTAPSRARSPGPTSIRSRSAPPASSKRPSTSWPSAGCRSSTPSTRTASTSATRSIRARISTTASPTRCSSSA